MRWQEITEAPLAVGDIATYQGGGALGQAFAPINTVINKRDELDQLSQPVSAAPVDSTAPSSANTGVGNGTAADPTSPQDKPARALAFFRGRGLTDAQAAGIVGNLQAESGVNLNPAAVGDGGRAWGIAQWHPDRRRTWEQVNRTQWRRDGSSPNFDQQLQHIWWEFNNTERAAYNRIRSARTAGAAAAIVDQYYERSSGAHRQKRIQNAQALMRSNTGTATA